MFASFGSFLSNKEKTSGRGADSPTKRDYYFVIFLHIPERSSTVWKAGASSTATTTASTALSSDAPALVASSAMTVGMGFLIRKYCSMKFLTRYSTM